MKGFPAGPGTPPGMGLGSRPPSACQPGSAHCQSRPCASDSDGKAAPMPMDSASAVSEWIDRLKAGDPVAVECLWGRYFERLVGLARIQLRGTPRRAADEEDV